MRNKRQDNIENKDRRRSKSKMSKAKAKKIEIFLSVVLAIALIVTVPVLAWFGNQKKLAKLAKIKAPDDLYINAAHKEDRINLDMRTIDVAQSYKDDQNVSHPIKSQNFVFSVSGNYVSRFTLQLEHTTNNPYTYTIHEGDVYKVTKDSDGVMTTAVNVKTGETIQSEHADYADRNADGSLKYVEYIATGMYDADEQSKLVFPSEVVNVAAGDTLWIYVGPEVKNLMNETGSYLNKASGSRIDDGTLTQKSYDTYTNFNMYADPVYWQLKKMKGGEPNEKGQPFYNTYVINVSWDGVADISKYDKETDIIYISAFVE